MSQKLVTVWKTRPKCVFFNVPPSPEQQTFQIWVGHNFVQYDIWELDFWMNKIQDRTQSWRSLLFKVFHCVCHVISCIFWKSKFIKKLKKKIIKQKKKKLKAWILLNQTRTKNKRARQLWDIQFIFLALSTFFLKNDICIL